MDTRMETEIARDDTRNVAETAHNVNEATAALNAFKMVHFATITNVHGLRCILIV